jgi:hypothetical protein
MRAMAVLVITLAVGGCTQATASRVDERTFKIDGPAMGMASDAPNRRLAERLCPKGFRILDSRTQAGGPDRAIDTTDRMTIWTIRCI